MNKGVTSMSDIKRQMVAADGDVSTQKDLLLFATNLHESREQEFRESMYSLMMLPPDEMQSKLSIIRLARNKAYGEYNDVYVASNSVTFKTIP